MRTRPFGRTGLEISELVFGGGYVGGILLHADDDTRRAVIARALSAGINWIDTAASYGNGASEEAIGWLLSELPAAERPQISTKFTLVPGSQGEIAAQIERSLEQSLKRLGMERVTLFQLHNPLGEGHLPLDPVLRTGGVCDVLDRLKERGVIAAAGFTALGDPAACHQLVRSGRMQSAQVYYNLLNPSAGHAVPAGWPTTNFGRLIDACNDAGVAVMNIRTFAGGVLASREPHGREVPITANAGLAIEQARAGLVGKALGKRFGSPAQTAVRFGLSHPGVSCVVIGLAEPGHLEQALAAADMGALPEAALAAVRPLWQDCFGER